MEEMGDLIGKGFGIWRNNLKLCLPFVLNLLVSILAMAPLFAVALTAIGPIQDLETISSEELLIRVQGSLVPLTAALALAAILLSLISSFFTAGAIGMARQALETGKTTTAAMWSAGKRHLWSLFAASVLIWAATLLGAIFMLPGVLLLLPQYLNPEPQNLAIFVGGIMLTVFYALLLSLILAVAPYALVVDSLGPVQAIKSSVTFFRYHKFDVFLLWLIVLAISIGLQMIGGSTTTGGNSVSYEPLSALTGLVNLLVLAPLSTVWWTRLYMDRNGKLPDRELNDPW